jgi:hypothetical protein
VKWFDKLAGRCLVLREAVDPFQAVMATDTQYALVGGLSTDSVGV